jgi:hypothetical protein
MPEAPIVCRLDAFGPRERERHAELSREVRARVLEVGELERGLSFVFAEDPVFSRRLIEWITLERRCCPFLEFELRLGDAREPVVLCLTGAEGVKEFLASELSPEAIS